MKRKAANIITAIVGSIIGVLILLFIWAVIVSKVYGNDNGFGYSVTVTMENVLEEEMMPSK